MMKSLLDDDDDRSDRVMPCQRRLPRFGVCEPDIPATIIFEPSEHTQGA